VTWRQRAHVPEETESVTKPTLGTVKFTGTAGAGVPFGWMAADEVYGRGSKLREACEKSGKGYVLAVPVNFRVRLPSGRRGFGYTTFVIDAFAGLIAGWECSLAKETPFVERAIRQGAASRARQGHPVGEPAIHHSDAESQHTSVHFDRDPDAGGPGTVGRHRRGCPGQRPGGATIGCLRLGRGGLWRPGAHRGAGIGHRPARHRGAPARPVRPRVKVLTGVPTSGRSPRWS
jgi:hypothetical protein